MTLNVKSQIMDSLKSNITLNNAKMCITPIVQIQIFACLHECNSSNYKLNELHTKAAKMYKLKMQHNTLLPSIIGLVVVDLPLDNSREPIESDKLISKTFILVNYGLHLIYFS